MMVKIEKLENIKSKPGTDDMARFFGFRITSPTNRYQVLSLHDSSYFYFFYLHMN
jgi:hypothetical protein